MEACMGWGQFVGKPLQVHTTAENRTRIEKIAAAEGVSQASVVRDLIDAGIDNRETLSKERRKKGARRG
jgi:hypothetical protein